MHFKIVHMVTQKCAYLISELKMVQNLEYILIQYNVITLINLNSNFCNENFESVDHSF